MNITALPDCRTAHDPFHLTVDQRRELLLLLAEKGEAGLDEFVKRHGAGDTALARRLAREKRRLMEDAEELRRRLHSDYEGRREHERQRLRHALDSLHREEADLARRADEARARLPAELEDRVRHLPIIELAFAPPRLSWARRAWNALLNLLASLWRLLLSLVGRRPRVTGKAKAIVVGVPGLAGPGVELEVDLASALRKNPRLRREVNRRLGDSWRVRARRLWRVMLGLEDYSEVARRIMEEEAKRAAQQREEEVRSDVERWKEEAGRRRQEEKRQQAESASELARLDAAEQEERSRLQEALAKKPQDRVKDLVVGELEAGGFVERMQGALQVTGRFLENLAALVYAEEAKGLGSSQESPLGSSIEGEGVLERTPLLSHDETSHMDVATTLVNARMRHPHVRHLLEEDVLVYRERRSTLTHLVLVIDKSLSMEENRRMEAAKRAALALYWGVRRKSPLNKVDVLLMDTSVRRADLQEAWAAKPGGFTNTGRALEMARALLEQGRATRRLLFVVTDGLPEALTLDGKDVAGRPDEALAYALAQAERLRRVPGLSTAFVLLEPDDPLFLKAGEKLAKRAGGRMLKVVPSDLTRNLLVELRQSEAATVPAA